MRTYIALPASVAAHLAWLAADTGRPSSTLWDTETSERGDGSAGMAADLAALD